MSHHSSQPLSPIQREESSDPVASGSAPDKQDVAIEKQEDGGATTEEVEGMQDDEGQAPRVLASPSQPSKEERRRHSCTHIPYLGATTA